MTDEDAFLSCAYCNFTKDAVDMASGRYCRDCRNAKRRANRAAGKYRESERKRQGCQYKRLYGITEAHYQEMLAEQNGRCACCNALPYKKRLSIDHDHLTGAVRGLLCVHCNAIIGHANDSGHWLRLGMAYLDKYGTVDVGIGPENRKPRRIRSFGKPIRRRSLLKALERQTERQKRRAMPLVRVSPQMAREWLVKNVSNRPVRRGYIKQLVGAIERNEWRLTGDTIKFASDGRLIDGHHRLFALAKSGRTLDMYVVRDVEAVAAGLRA